MIEKLQRYGLSEKEAFVYYELLKKKQALANELAQSTGTNRTFTYNVLQSLVNKGLVSYFIKNNKRFYIISNPESLLSSIREKEKIAKELVEDIKKFKPAEKVTQKVEVYEGNEALRIVHEEMIKAKNPKVLNSTGLLFQHLKYSAYHIIKDLSEKPDYKVIACQSAKKTKLPKQFKETNIKFLPRGFDNYATTLLFDGKLIFQIIKDKPFIIKIENKEIFEGYSKIFDLLWNKLM